MKRGTVNNLQLKMKRIKLAADIKESDRLNSAFVGACEVGDEKIVKMLLPWVKRNGVNCSDSLGVTGLMAALVSDQYEVAGLLLDLPGIDITARDNDGRTVLDYLLKSKSFFYLEEILDKLALMLTTEEVNELILKKITECLSDFKKHTTVFRRLLPYYDIEYKSGKLFNRALKYAGESTILALEFILQFYGHSVDDLLKLSPDNVTALVAATAEGHSGLIGKCLLRQGLVDMKKFLKLCRKKGVQDEIVNQELYEVLCYMIEEDLCTELESSFNLGLELFDINYQDVNGVTILMQAVKVIHKLGSKGLRVVEKILKMDKLASNLMTANGESSLDFLRFSFYDNLPNNLKARETRLHHLSPVVNRKSAKTFIPENIMKTLPLDVQILDKFKERQDIFKDLDFNFVKHSLLTRAMAASRLDLVRFLIINCNVKVLHCDFEKWEKSVQQKRRELKEEPDLWGEARKVLTNILEKLAQEDADSRRNSI
eukprot:GFUD01042086.1.p1 GENE.GFUD01042086.1~~GFUD01042086.1.p1  ORF type:complete len:485 (+),score=88.89 GFUD01042086.1:73-1527(+)